MKESSLERRHKHILEALGIGVGLWGVLLVFENAYFAAPAFNVPTPTWLSWVGSIPLLWLNVIDTFAVAAIAAITVLGYYWLGPGRRKRRMRQRGVGAAGAILLLVFLVLLVYVLYTYGHVTLSSLWCSLQGFAGGHC